MSCDPVGSKHCIDLGAGFPGMGWWTLKIQRIGGAVSAVLLDAFRALLVTAYYLINDHESTVNQWFNGICYAFHRSATALTAVVQPVFKGGAGVSRSVLRESLCIDSPNGNFIAMPLTAASEPVQIRKTTNVSPFELTDHEPI